MIAQAEESSREAAAQRERAERSEEVAAGLEGRVEELVAHSSQMEASLQEGRTSQQLYEGAALKLDEMRRQMLSLLSCEGGGEGEDEVAMLNELGGQLGEASRRASQLEGEVGRLQGEVRAREEVVSAAKERESRLLEQLQWEAEAKDSARERGEAAEREVRELRAVLQAREEKENGEGRELVEQRGKVVSLEAHLKKAQEQASNSSHTSTSNPSRVLS